MSSQSIDEFKQEVRGWVEENLPADLRVGNRRNLPKESLAQWIKALVSRGWVTRSGPPSTAAAGSTANTLRR